jgi:cytochrome c oxidase accessory protein FixG
MPPVLKKPNLDSVTTINRDGSRFFPHPSDVKGRFTTARRLTGILLIAIYVLLPWIPINGHPAVLLDVTHRKFHLFGLTLLVQDVWLLFFLVSGVGFSLFYVTSLLGRIWCGWACPYTVFLDHVFRRIERWIEGDATARRQLDAAPWGPAKIAKRGLKHLLFAGCALGIAHIGLSYFIPLPELYAWMRQSPSNHATVFIGVMAYAGALYFCFAWFREQFCIVLCPYGRLQSALTDDDTMVIGYDYKRGEPRGKATEPGTGDCIDCRRCVQVCPTGIDIRNGLQMECIGCAACVDACNDIMDKVKRPRGLVRYDSHKGLTGQKRRIIRPRIILYTGLGLLGAAVLTLGLTRVHSFEMSLVRLRGMPYIADPGHIRNQFTLRLLSKDDTPTTFTISTTGAPAGLTLSGVGETLTVPPSGELQQTLMLSLDRPNYTGPFKFTIQATPKSEGKPLTREVEFLGPDL